MQRDQDLDADLGITPTLERTATPTPPVLHETPTPLPQMSAQTTQQTPTLVHSDSHTLFPPATAIVPTVAAEETSPSAEDLEIAKLLDNKDFVFCLFHL